MISTFFPAGVEHAYAGFMSHEHNLPHPWRHASIPSPVGLSAGDLTELSARVAEWADGWCVERCDDCEGGHEAVLMLEDDETASSFVVRREAGRVHLDVCRDDSYARLGSYGTIAQAVQAAAEMLARPRFLA